MNFLTFDTSLDNTYISLFDNDKEIDSKIIESTEDKYHSAFFLLNIVDLLKDNDLTLKNLNALGVNIGPGSFTGIRACLTIARVIAQQLELPLIGISSLEILSGLNKTDNPSIIVMDARKGMCYFAQYDKDGKVLQEAHLEPTENLNLDDKTYTIISDKFMYNLLKERGISSLCYTETEHNLGRILGSLTAKKFRLGGDFNWAAVKPLYLQSPSITISKKSLI